MEIRKRLVRGSNEDQRFISWSYFGNLTFLDKSLGPMITSEGLLLISHEIEYFLYAD